LVLFTSTATRPTISAFWSALRGANHRKSLTSVDVALFSASRVSQEKTPVALTPREVSSALSDANLRTAAAVPALPAGQRLLWAWRLRDLSLLYASNGVAQAERLTRPNLLLRRSMKAWAQRVAPFLVPDGEPYPVVTPTGVVWMLDLLSATTHLPLVPSTQRGGALQGYNAARDSVKMTRDTQTGKVAFYTAGREENDPLLEPWRRAFPSLVKPWHEMPAVLRRHCRYPRTLFEVQRDALRSTVGTAKPETGTATSPE
jgi:hypothetical protein